MFDLDIYHSILPCAYIVEESRFMAEHSFKTNGRVAPARFELAFILCTSSSFFVASEAIGGGALISPIPTEVLPEIIGLSLLIAVELRLSFIWIKGSAFVATLMVVSDDMKVSGVPSFGKVASSRVETDCSALDDCKSSAKRSNNFFALAI